MSLHLEMIQAARVAPKILGDATGLVRRFLTGLQCSNGGFPDRAGRSDPYYTVFALDAAAALQHDIDWAKAVQYLEGLRTGGSLDFVHACCVIRAMAVLGKTAPALVPDPWEVWRAALCSRVESFRSLDGGYHPRSGRERGSAYGSFLALGAFQDAGLPLPHPERLVASLGELQAPDGGWSNEPGLSHGGTNATAAALTVLRHLGGTVPRSAVEWLWRQRHVHGGFVASPGTPLPDLLSTATALHALAGEQVPLHELREACLDFVDSLWTNAGAFHGHWADDAIDVEYTFYGLLALGHLSE